MIQNFGCPGGKASRLRRVVLRIFFKILVMRANFGDFGILLSTSKFWKNLVRIVRPYWDKFWKILTFEFWWNRKVMINHRGGILIFGQNFVEILKFWILGLRINQILWFRQILILGLRISNFRFRQNFHQICSILIKNWNFVV